MNKQTDMLDKPEFTTLSPAAAVAGYLAFLARQGEHSPRELRELRAKLAASI